MSRPRGSFRAEYDRGPRDDADRAAGRREEDERAGLGEHAGDDRERISACCAGAGGVSLTSASTSAPSESNCSARLWRRSKPTVEIGLADSRRRP